MVMVVCVYVRVRGVFSVLVWVGAGLLCHKEFEIKLFEIFVFDLTGYSQFFDDDKGNKK